MENISGPNNANDPSVPEGYVTFDQYVQENELTEDQAAFLVRSAADDVNRFYDEMGREIPEATTPPPVHVLRRTAGGEDELYFHQSRLSELLDHIREERSRRNG